MLDNLESPFFFETQVIELSFTNCNIGLWSLQSQKIELMAHTRVKAYTYDQIIISPLNPLNPNSRNLQRLETTKKQRVCHIVALQFTF
jgi:hypothetical protein